MINSPNNFRIKGPYTPLHTFATFVHRAANGRTLRPKPIHLLDNSRPPVVVNLAENLADPNCVRLAVLSDLHIPYGRSEANLKAAIGELQAHNPQPDAVLVTGDLTQSGGRRAFAFVHEQLNRLGLPYFVIPGNHDVRGVKLNRLQRYFDMPLDYSLDFGSVRLLMIGSCDHEVPAASLDWIDSELSQYATVPHLLFMHFHPLPIVRFSTNKALGWWLDMALPRNTTELMQLLTAHSNLRAVFHGHCHLSVHQQFRGVSVIGTGSLSAHQPGQTAQPSYRLVTFENGVLQARTKFVGGHTIENEPVHVVDDLYRCP